MTMQRRKFLAAGSAALAAGLGGLGPALMSLPARGATTDGYRALVCVFLFGGMDNHDTVIPYDSASYNGWAGIRSSLVNAQGGSRSRDNLLPLSPLEDTFGGRQFALPPEMPGLSGLFQSGNAALVGNVGPLLRPTDAASFNADSVPLPSRLFSHNDQQATWMSGAPEGARFGWAGLFGDLMRQAGANGDGTFAAITTGGADLLITGRETTPYQVVGEDGAVETFLLQEVDGGLQSLLTTHLRAERYAGDNLLGRDLAARIRGSFDANLRYNQAALSTGGSGVTFPASELGVQLGAVASAIAARDALGVSRQVFTVGMGGFDTHSAQARDLPALQRQLDEAIVAFHSAMQAMGLGNDVALFTASDFGRTLAINGDGTDHGWGGHQFVVGGGVRGQRIFGGLPPAELGHSRDAGSGRLIPDVSVEQFAAPLGRWFGLGNEEIAAVFPNLTAFDGPPALFG